MYLVKEKARVDGQYTIVHYIVYELNTKHLFTPSYLASVQPALNLGQDWL